MTTRTTLATALAALFLAACNDAGVVLSPPAHGGGPSAIAAPDASSVDDAIHAAFTAEPPADQVEAYVCYSIAVAGIDDVDLGRVVWHPPTGSVFLHHASLYAAASLPPPGPVSCDPMPERVAALGVYTPGAAPLDLPPGVAIRLPAGTGRLLVLAHVYRTGDGPAGAVGVDLETARGPVEHVVNWVDIFGPVPVLFPHRTATAVGSCRFDVPAHVVTSWPHMHAYGTQFHGVIVRKGGRREHLLDVDPWDIDHQPIYPVDAQLEPGDTVETQCTWVNPTNADVLPGPYAANEMCNQGLFVWPFDAARCANEPDPGDPSKSGHAGNAPAQTSVSASRASGSRP